jgi:hypothetical protein
MGKKRKRNLKKKEAVSAPNDTAMVVTDDPGMADEPSSLKVRKGPGKLHDEEQVIGALIAAIMDIPVDPGLGVDPEWAADLREEVAELQARGIIVEIPCTCDGFDPDDWRD